MKKLIIATFLFFAANKYYTQTATTFTANNAQITDTLMSGGVIEAHRIHAADTVVAEKDIIANEDVKISGNLYLNGNMVLDPTNDVGVKYFNPASNSSSVSVVSFGKTVGNLNPIIQNCPVGGTMPSPWLLTSGGYISAVTNPTNQVNASLKIYTAPWNGFGFIELEGVNEVGFANNALEINYFCGRNTHINRNFGLSNGGGWVRMGRKVSMDAHVDIGDSISGITGVPNNIALNIFTNSGRGIVLKTTHAPTNLINVLNTNSPNDMLFTLRGDGVVQIGKNNQAVNVPLLVYGNGANEAFEIRNPVNEEINFRVKTNGFVYAREVRVMTGTFPDFVFEKDYRRMSLKDLETFIYKNKRLPGFENTDYYIQNGINTSEMFVKQQETIENLTLYIIELEKRISEIEKNQNK